MWKEEKNYDKWTQPGWRIEQKYANKVLIGNWVEERLQFTREFRTANSTNRLDYRPQWDYRPDTFVRRTALRRGEGLPTKVLLAHHDTPASHFLVTQYDEMYGRKGDSAMPKLRTWDSNKLAWVPELSDHATKVPPTNFGLAEARWRVPRSADGAKRHQHRAPTARHTSLPHSQPCVHTITPVPPGSEPMHHAATSEPDPAPKSPRTWRSFHPCSDWSLMAWPVQKASLASLDTCLRGRIQPTRRP